MIKLIVHLLNYNKELNNLMILHINSQILMHNIKYLMLNHNSNIVIQNKKQKLLGKILS